MASATLDYAKETFKLTLKNVDLGTYAEGPQPVVVAIDVGPDRVAVVRMVRKGKSLAY